KNLQGMVLVIGIEDDPSIKGKISHVPLSNQKGDSLDPNNIYFRRNSNPKNPSDNRVNQIVTFSNMKPKMKEFAIVLLPNGFGRSNWVQDYDGLPEASPQIARPQYICNVP
ncbi:MAG TPA: hypothetical protein VEL47_00520, partial [Myxococcota bacterium]|nr:hypothetical protein [Myxococcota bacterium]